MNTKLNKTHIGKMIEVRDVHDGPWKHGRPIQTEPERRLMTVDELMDRIIVHDCGKKHRVCSIDKDETIWICTGWCPVEDLHEWGWKVLAPDGPQSLMVEVGK